MPNVATIATIGFQKSNGKYQLDDLWFMVGSRCNLRCIHCYVDSSPENDFLEPLTLEEVQRYLQEAFRYGVQHIYFTGGEPFLNKQILPMIREALHLADVTVLTNGTSPILRYLDELEILNRQSGGKLNMRVSMDHYIQARHDAIRGHGTFEKTVENTVRLRRKEIPVIITVTPEVFRGNRVSAEIVSQEFTQIFRQRGVEVSVKVLPAVLEMGAQARRKDDRSPFDPVTEERLEQSAIQKEKLMCYNGRSVLKRNGECRVYPCPIIYEVPDFDLGATLEDSFQKIVPLIHRACSQYCCLRRGQSTCTD